MAFDYKMTPLLAKLGKNWDELSGEERKLLTGVYDAGWTDGLETGREEALGLDA